MGRLLSAVCALALVGCSANNNSIFRTHDVAGNGPGAVNVALIDAKQRAIITQRTSNPENRSIVCPEPSPDVFSVLGSSFGAGGAFGTQGVEASAEVQKKIAEAGGSIGLRTQTITAMRDLMFYLCTYYMAGAVEKQHVQAAIQRQGKLLTAIVAIEQLTGAATPATVTVNANSGDVNVTPTLTGKTISKDSNAKTSEAEGESLGAVRQPASGHNGTGIDGPERLWLVAEQGGAADPDAKPAKTTPGTGGLVIDAKTDVGSIAAAVTQIVRMVFDDDEVESVCILKILNNEKMDDDTRAFCKLNQKLATTKRAITLEKLNDDLRKLHKDRFKK